MTTLVGLLTKDALVFGCDSLGSITERLVDPFDLMDFFDKDKEYTLKLDGEGKPILKSFNEIYQKCKSIPSEHMPHMTKLFLFQPLNISVMISGITSIGQRTVRNIIEEFKADTAKTIGLKGDYSVKDIAEALVKHITKYYEGHFKKVERRPFLELILGGYGKEQPLAEIYRIRFPEKTIEEGFKKGAFGIVFGGQTKEIQRLVFGTDGANKIRLRKRHTELLRKYREKIQEFLKGKGISTEIPEPTREDLSKDLDLFGNNWRLIEFDARWGDFSEQNAIECVDFFIDIMIKSQQFSSGMPTVGGEVHIALITKDDSKFVSKEEYYHEGHYVPKHKES